MTYFSLTFWIVCCHVILTFIFVPHILLTKEDDRAAWGWIMAVIFYPIIGCIIYTIFGVNRIHHKAQAWRSELKSYNVHMFSRSSNLDDEAYFGHHIDLFCNGDEAYPAMLAAIDQAQHFIFLSTYVFRGDETGKKFVEALARAQDRGVQVRVLIDGFGTLLHTPFCPAGPLLKARNIPYAMFLYSLWPWRMPYLNLRNHQKILIIDGKLLFTGGINISSQNVLQTKTNSAQEPDWKIIDCHFCLQGSAVGHAQAAFQKEWFFATHEDLRTFHVCSPSTGLAYARGLSSGPDLDINPINWAILERLVQAKDHVAITSPYFLPDASLINVLCLIARLGVRIEIIIPSRNNMPFVEWAASTRLKNLLAAGCHIYKSCSQQFDHSKLMLVDNNWVLFGSHNWDARSLRLNFEFNIECLDERLAQKVFTLFEAKKACAQRLSMEDFCNRPLPVKLRDSLARLFSPYL